MRGVRAGFATLTGLLTVSLFWPAPTSTAGIAARPAQGKLLVAARSLGDPNFEQTVVLLLEYSAEGAVGVIVNRPTKMRLSLLPGLKAPDSRLDVVYEGGPVLSGGILALLRSDSALEEATHVVDDVYVTADRETLQGLLDQGVPGDRLRVYSGYAGWGPGQLDAEVARKDWLILPIEAATIFDASPGEMWSRLIRRESDLVASFSVPYPSAAVASSSSSRRRS